MKGGLNLHKVRVGIVIPLFLLFFLSFLGEERFLEYSASALFFFQFVPSMLRFISDPGNILCLGCIVVLVTTFLCGRVYCSFVCPLGMLQDCISWIFGKVGLKRKYLYGKPFYRFQLLVVLLTFLTATLGFLTLLNLLDPYSFFGRITAHLGKSILVVINNIIVNILESFDIYDLSIKRQHHVPLSILVLTGVSLGCLVFLSIFTGRLYCNSICPVGALLGLVSRFSLYSMEIDRLKCSSCNLCAKVCKAGCIESNKQEVDRARCVICFNCLAVCHTSAMGYRSRIRGNIGLSVSLKRRAFLGSMGAIIFSWSSETLLLASTMRKAFAKDSPVTPPGSVNLDHFSSMCSGCHLCVSACPTHTLVPSMLKYGLTGLLQPEMNYRRGHCEISCTLCGSVCPTGAIIPISENEKKQIQIGVVSLKKELCVVHVKKIHCGACGEACPTNAIFPVEKGRVVFPEINNQYCIGCGACQRVCPTMPKSIVVTANRVHKTADLYVPPDLPVSAMEVKADFPF